MNKKPINLNLFEGVIVPGETYLLHRERNVRYDAGPIEFLYTIRSAGEVEAAIELEMDVLFAEIYEFRELLGVRRLGDGRYLLRLWCHDKREKRNGSFYFCLHRIRGVKEMLKLYKDGWRGS